MLFIIKIIIKIWIVFAAHGLGVLGGPQFVGKNCQELLMDRGEDGVICKGVNYNAQTANLRNQNIDFFLFLNTLQAQFASKCLSNSFHQMIITHF